MLELEAIPSLPRQEAEMWAWGTGQTPGTAMWQGQPRAYCGLTTDPALLPAVLMGLVSELLQEKGVGCCPHSLEVTPRLLPQCSQAMTLIAARKKLGRVFLGFLGHSEASWSLEGLCLPRNGPAVSVGKGHLIPAWPGAAAHTQGHGVGIHLLFFSTRVLKGFHGDRHPAML
jgi:hypothetical protein